MSFLFAGLTLVVSGFAVSGPRRGGGGGGGALTDESASAIREAMQLTKASAGNITAAYQACSLWEELLGKEAQERIPTDIRVLTLAMQASCLVRCGRDEAALPVYDEALSLQSYMDENSRNDLILEKASSLQRLLRYEAAKSEYLKAQSDRALIGAATCALRVGDLESAAQILQSGLRNSDDSDPSEARGMSAIVDSMLQPSIEEIAETGHILPALNLTTHLSPLFAWVSHVYMHYLWINTRRDESDEAMQSDESSSTVARSRSTEILHRYTFLDFAYLNNGAFDDPLLGILDDKVRLHQLLAGNSRGLKCEFWPEGFILPTDESRLNAAPRDLAWVCKSRSGYGSHGNVAMSSNDALAYSMLMDSSDDQKLLQRMVEPPLLLDGRKFTMRVYVVYFVASTDLPAEVHILRNGLVKIASLPYGTDVQTVEDASRVHMTNTGREASMDQQDFTYLRVALSQSRILYDDLWDKIRDSVRTLFLLYHDEALRMEETPGPAWLRASVGRLGVPKILGLDFMVDNRGQPWLLEVNRFPGLEPRDERDAEVKHQVVRDAWTFACRRQGFQSFSWLDWEESTS